MTRQPTSARTSDLRELLALVSVCALIILGLGHAAGLSARGLTAQLHHQLAAASAQYLSSHSADGQPTLRTAFAGTASTIGRDAVASARRNPLGEARAKAIKYLAGQLTGGVTTSLDTASGR